MRSRTLQLSNIPEQDGWGIVLSLVLHGLLLLLLVLYQHFFASSRQLFTPNFQSVSLVGAAPAPQAPPAPPKPAPPAPTPPAPPKPAPPAPVPPLPPKPAAEPIAPKPPQVKPPEPVKPQAAPPKPAPPRADSSRELEQRLQTLQREQERRRASEAEAARRQQAALDEAISRLERQAANPARAGGGAPNEMDPRLQAYNQQLHDLIHRNWVVPEGINTRGLVVVINFNIRRDGTAERIWLEQTSGNPVYDQSGLRAAEKAAPFPPPPSIIRSPLYEVGIRFSYDG